MNDFLVQYGTSRVHGETWVMVPEPNSRRIIAYYTVSPDPVEFGGDNPGDVDATVIELDRLAVDVGFQRQGIGQNLLVRVILQTLEQAEMHSIEALILVALDAESKDWYLSRKLGFRQLSPDSNLLALPVSAMRQLPDV